MSPESVTHIECFRSSGAEPATGRRVASGLSRGLRAVLGRREPPALIAGLSASAAAPDVAAALCTILGPGIRLEPRRTGPASKEGPILVLVHAEPAAGVRRGDGASAAALAHLVRASGLDVVPVQAVVERGGGALARAGAPIRAERLARIADEGELARFLRGRAAVLRHRSAEAVQPPQTITSPVPVAGPLDADLVERELAELPPGQCLAESGRFVVLQARAHQIPASVREIGRLRELTFRAAGEGTGRALDLDAWDRSYRHLVLFDREARRIAGAYRFAPTDEIVPVFGLAGLYTSTLFRLDPALPGHLGPAIELGRSFVRAEYQRGYAPLLLLWRGLCAYVAANPRYRTLFGAVSVAATYGLFSRELIATALSRPPALHPLAVHVSPRHELRPRRVVRDELHRLAPFLDDASELSTLVADLEVDGKGLPVLLREYLKLGGRLLGWSIDPAFGSVLDGLIAVDLPAASGRLLDHYMGREAAGRYRRHHGCDTSGA